MAKSGEARKGGWTSGQRKKLSGIRRAHTSDPKDFVFDRNQAWKDLCERRAAEGEAPQTLDLEVERKRLAQLTSTFAGLGLKGIHGDYTKPLIGFWVGTVGLAEVHSMVFPDPEHPPSVRFGEYQMWNLFPILRRYTLAADDAQYEEARSRMEPVFRRLDASGDYDQNKLRDWLAYLFSRDSEWSHELIRRDLEGGGPRRVNRTALVLVGATDPQLALDFSKLPCGVTMTEYWAYDLVESFDVAARPMLEHFVEIYRSARDKKPFQAALKIVAKLEALGTPATPTAPAGSASLTSRESDLPAGLLDPWAAARASKASKPKKPKKVASPPDVLVLDVTPDRRAEWEGREAKRQYRSDEEALLRQIDSHIAQPKLYLGHALQHVYRDLRPESRVAWLDGLSARDFKEVTKDRNGIKPFDLLEAFLLPLGIEGHAERWLKLIHALKAEHFVEMGQWVRSASIAVRMAEIAAGKKGAALAKEWLLEHPVLAADALVPAAVNVGGKKQGAYLAALEILREGGHGDEVDRAFGAVSSEARAYLAAVSGADAPLARPESMPPYWKPAALPKLERKDGKGPLEPEVVEEIGRMMKASPADAPLPGLREVVEFTTDRSRAEFAWTLMETWLRAGADPQERWPLTHLGLLAGDALVDRLAGALLDWAHHGQHARAFWGLKVLGRLGSENAARALWRIAKESPFDGLRERCDAALLRIASSRSLTLDELYDELVPDFGLKVGETIELSFGPRSFEARITPGLKVQVRGEDGEVRDGLPKPRKSDDEGLARKAASRLSKLKQDVRNQAKDQGARLERAMVDQRRWRPERFRQVLVEHPVMTYLAQSIVWGLYDDAGKLQAAFRVDESRGLTDADDDAVKLDESHSVGVLHALELEASAAERWGELFSDYEIVQPFEQLGRTVFDRAAVEDAVKVEGTVVGSGRLRGLRRRGWTRGRAEDAGLIHCMHRTVRAAGSEREVTLHFDPGLAVGAQDMVAEQTLARLDMGDLSELSPISASEIVLDLEVLSAT